MRIALLHTRYARGGGVEKYVAGLAERLLRVGHEVHYFSRPPAGPDRPPPGLVLHPVHYPRWPEALKHLAFAYRSAALVRRAARRTPFDAVHGFSGTFEQDVYTDGSGAAAEFAGMLARLERSAVGRAWARSAPRRLAALHLEGRRLRDPALRRVLAMSALVRDQILERHAVPPERIEVLHPPVDPGEFDLPGRERWREEVRRRWCTPVGARVVLFVGNGFARKGLDVLIDALARLGDRRSMLWVLGRDRRTAWFRERARALGVEARFPGFTSDPAPVYAAADVFALPSRFDAFGAAALEAMAAGLPVVVSSRAGSSELVREGESGFVLREPESAPALSTLLDALSDPDLRERLGAGARATAERCSWDRHLTRVLAAYQLAAEKR
jgi:UDP-glucose:(heptosyl)LPS alpha-1,3-glucosyltransferase